MNPSSEPIERHATRLPVHLHARELRCSVGLVILGAMNRVRDTHIEQNQRNHNETL